MVSGRAESAAASTDAPDGSGIGVSPDFALSPTSRNAPRKHDADEASAPRRVRVAPGTWEQVIQFIGSTSKTTDDILEHMEAQGRPIKRANLRAQMSNYKKKGLVSNDSKPGQYHLTEAGRSELEITAAQAHVTTINGSGAQHEAP